MFIRCLERSEQAAAENIFRSAFAKQLRFESPEKFAPGYSLLARFVGEPEGAFGAFADDELVGVGFCNSLGSLGIFGPAAVKPDLWGTGIGQQLVQAAIDYFHSQGTMKIGLTTFPDSGKHVALYGKLGFHPRFSIAMMERAIEQNVEPKSAPPFRRFSTLSTDEQAKAFEYSTMITDTIYEGMHFCRQIGVAGGLGIGETLIVDDRTSIVGFALCHYGPGAETEAGVCEIRHAAVLPSAKSAQHFSMLLDACMAYATEKGAKKLFFGVNTGRRRAFEQVLSAKFRIESMGLAMHNPDEPFTDRAEVFLLDDWR